MSIINKVRRVKHIIQKHTFEFVNLYFGSEHILIYTAGKVGSSSIYLSLKPILKGKLLFTHRMLNHNIAKHKKHFKSLNKMPPFQQMGRLAYNQLIKKNKPVKIITAVREPIARTISAYFQDFDMYTKDEDLTIDQITKSIEKTYPIEDTLNWWLDEFIPVTNIDIYNQGFDREKKFEVYKQNNIEVLVFRIDLKDSDKEKLISDFLEVDNFKLVRHNETSLKSTSAINKEIKLKGKFSEAYINHLLNHKSTTTFFTEKEIEDIKFKWLRTKKS